ncbi:MAG: Holo-[acyl-carrier-protein] synthase [Chlamydiae bacterium]|nr:Holo-[acyl-carrier-protein] synthase [Chlamydiota bacterium]
MSCKGIGNDILEIARLKKAIQEHGQPFLDRILTKAEQDYCQKQADPNPRYAGRFAAKEAIVKALGCGFGSKARWLDIEILASDEGKPIVSFSDELAERFQNPTIHLSISHSHNYATAVAIWTS